MPESLSDPPADPQAPPGGRARMLRNERLLLASLALLAILRMHSEPPRSSLSALAGILSAPAILAKFSNGVVLIPAAAVFGDPTVRSMFFEALEWRTRPLAAFLDHPLFSLWGLQHFLDGLCRDFWRGRFKWNGEFMSHPLADAVYVATTAFFLAAVSVSIARELLGWLRRRRPSLPPGLCACTGAWLSAPAARSPYNWFHLRDVEYGSCGATPPWRSGIHKRGES